MSRVHDLVFQMVSNSHAGEDARILSLVKELASVGVTADQLGAPEDFAVPLPAAVRNSSVSKLKHCILKSNVLEVGEKKDDSKY